MALRDLSNTLSKLNWPLCTCRAKCSSEHYIVPKWAEGLGELDPCQNTLNLLELDLTSPYFIKGLAHAIQGLSHLKTDPLFIILELVINKFPFATEMNFGATEKKLTKLVKCSSFNLEYRAHGFFCGYIIFGHQHIWTDWRVGEINASTYQFTNNAMSNRLIELIGTAGRLHAWLDVDENHLKFQIISALIRCALFWTIQATLYCIDDIKRICTFGWARTRDEYQCGLLIWQCGWMVTHPKICKILFDVLCFD